MSNIPLSNIREVIERSLFHRIRIECVDKGYLPDRLNLTMFPETPQGQTAFENAINTISDGLLGFAIEVFNNSGPIEKGRKKIPRIIIRTQNALPGALGGDQTRKFRTVEGGYEAYITPPQTVDYFFEIRMASENAKQDRVLNAIVALALPKRGYIPWWDSVNRVFEADKTFFLEYVSFYDDDDEDSGNIEKVFVYKVSDCWDTEDIVLPGVIPGLKEITLDIEVNSEALVNTIVTKTYSK